MNHHVCGTAVDNRCGCAALVSIGEQLKGIKHKSDIYLVGTVWEEFNIRGAVFAARKVKPDLAICMDVTMSGDTSDLSGKYDIGLGRGAAVGMYNFHGRGTLNGCIGHQGLYRLALKCAEQNQIPLQEFATLGMLTDADVYKRQEENKKRIEEALEIVGLSAYRTCLPQELSGGMMQRVNIARAMVFNPELLIMDQPFGALDAITRKKLRFDFLRIFEQSQKSIVIVTNSIDEALLFSNRIYVMSGGPGTIENVVTVDVPFEERTTEVATNERFTALRKQMIKIVKQQYGEEV